MMKQLKVLPILISICLAACVTEQRHVQLLQPDAIEPDIALEAASSAWLKVEGEPRVFALSDLSVCDGALCGWNKRSKRRLCVAPPHIERLSYSVTVRRQASIEQGAEDILALAFFSPFIPVAAGIHLYSAFHVDEEIGARLKRLDAAGKIRLLEE